MSTSGSYEKFFTADGKIYSHIMDPRTGFPAKGMISVSVIASAHDRQRGLDQAFLYQWARLGVQTSASWNSRFPLRGRKIIHARGSNDESFSRCLPAPPTDVRPVWFMRQAGRYLKQYREIRSKHGILEMCMRPDLAAAVTLQPVEILDVDAADNLRRSAVAR